MNKRTSRNLDFTNGDMLLSAASLNSLTACAVVLSFNPICAGVENISSVLNPENHCEKAFFIFR